jgi:hypothetical protein
LFAIKYLVELTELVSPLSLPVDLQYRMFTVDSLITHRWFNIFPLCPVALSILKPGEQGVPAHTPAMDGLGYELMGAMAALS